MIYLINEDEFNAFCSKQEITFVDPKVQQQHMRQKAGPSTSSPMATERPVSHVGATSAVVATAAADRTDSSQLWSRGYNIHIN